MLIYCNTAYFFCNFYHCFKIDDRFLKKPKLSLLSLATVALPFNRLTYTSQERTLHNALSRMLDAITIFR